MDKLLTAALMTVLMCTAAVAKNEAPASDASIREVLELTNAQQILVGIKDQAMATMNGYIQNATRGQTLTPEQQAILERMIAKMSALMSDALSWNDFLPIYLRTYRESFTQDEIDGLIKFYKSAPGRAYAKKLPVVSQNVMRELPEMLKPMQEKIMAIQKESLQELKDLQAKESKK